MLRKQIILLFLFFSACAPIPAVETVPLTDDAQAYTPSPVSTPLTGSPVIGSPGGNDGPPPTPTVIGTVSADGIDSYFATITLSPTGTLEAILNPDLGISVDNPLRLNLSATPVYVLNLRAAGYTIKIKNQTYAGYYYFVDNPKAPGRVKLAFTRPGIYTVSIAYTATDDRTGKTSDGTLDIPFNVEGSPDDGAGGGDGGGGGPGGGGDGGGGIDN